MAKKQKNQKAVEAKQEDYRGATVGCSNDRCQRAESCERHRIYIGRETGSWFNFRDYGGDCKYFVTKKGGAQ